MTVVADARPARVGAPTVGRAAVHISHLTKRFVVRRGWVDSALHPFRAQRAIALNRVSLDVREGEFFGLLGPNGAGKTTLFKILSTLVLPDEGKAEIGGHDIARHPARVREILAPVIADERSLNWRLTSTENLRIYAALQGLRGPAMRDRVDEVLDLVELADTGTKLVGKFSSGMKQRLLIARALLGRPRVLLLDEPTRALDPISARRLRHFLRDELSNRQGCTILLATHNTEEATEFCDRVGVLHRGELLRVGSPGQLREEFRDHDCRLWVRAADWSRFRAVAELRLDLHPESVESDDPDWMVARVRMPGGADQISAVVAELVRADIGLARVEPVDLALADLIERIVGRGRGKEPNV